MIIKTSTLLQQFIQDNYQKNLAQLAFKKKLVEGYDNRFVLNQLYGKQKAKHKLPYLFQNNQVLYPAKVSVEQSSSEKTAIWKANLVSGETLLDMTGGFGVDTYHFAKPIQQVTYLEKNRELFEIVAHNYRVLNTNNITTIHDDSLTFLKNTNQQFDWIYLDPARRDEVGNRKIGLAGYFPNLIKIQSVLFQKTNNILVKVSPMLDIQQAIQQLGTIEKIIVLAVQNEVKELLFVLRRANGFEQTPIFECVDLRKNGQAITYTPTTNSDNDRIKYGSPQSYIYEPNAAILKAGLFAEMALDFDLIKLHPNTHLYTSEQLVTNFPGRTFSLKSVENFNKKAIASYLENKKANITTRNFPYSVAQIKKKLGVKDGGNIYLFATTLVNDKLAILVCEKSL